jgi:hypothetical protein
MKSVTIIPQKKVVDTFEGEERDEEESFFTATNNQ